MASQSLGTKLIFSMLKWPPGTPILFFVAIRLLNFWKWLTFKRILNRDGGSYNSVTSE